MKVINSYTYNALTLLIENISFGMTFNLTEVYTFVGKTQKQTFKNWVKIDSDKGCGNEATAYAFFVHFLLSYNTWLTSSTKKYKRLMYLWIGIAQLIKGLQ